MFNPKENILNEQLAVSGLEMSLDPVTGLAIGGAILGGATSFFGTNSANSQKKKAAERQNKYNKAVYEFQWGDVDSKALGGEALRQYEYAVEGAEIAARNAERNAQYQEAEMVAKYDYGMSIRAYEYNQAVRAYDQSVERAVRQQEFNEMAEEFALLDQDRLLHEQLLSIAFDEQETLQDWAVAVAGASSKKRQAKSAAAIEAQATRVSGMKAAGEAQASGQSGRSAAKSVQGILAETGARQGAIIDEFMFNTEAAETDFFNLNTQLAIDNAALESSKESAMMSDTASRNKIKFDALQAIINAEASILLKPEIGPALPVPMALPRMETQEVYKPAKPPKPMKNVAMQSNPFVAAVGGALQGAQLGQLGRD